VQQLPAIGQAQQYQITWAKTVLLPGSSQRLAIWRTGRNTRWKYLNGSFDEGIQQLRGKKVLHALAPLSGSTAASQLMTDSVSGVPDSENPGGVRSKARLIRLPELLALHVATTINFAIFRSSQPAQSVRATGMPSCGTMVKFIVGPRNPKAMHGTPTSVPGLAAA
jgi:hypothetical protein